jgi:hypothetical protein
MNWPLPSLLLALTLLSSCKIVLTVPPGGRVVSQSGSEVCNSGESCEISVSDAFFNEEFIAEPDGDHTFSHWIKSSKHFCGGSDETCTLSTENFDDNPSLMSFLETDEKFYLRPAYLQKGEFENENARVCFNPELYEKGTRQFIEDLFAITLNFSGVEFRSERHQKTESLVEGPENIDGRAALRVSAESVIESSSTFPPDMATERFDGDGYFVVNFPAAKVTQIASRASTEDITPGGSSMAFDQTLSENIWQAGWEKRYDLEPGQGYTYQIKESLHNETWEGAEHKVRDSKVTLWRDITYRGVETITVPAGTFRACRFDSYGTTTAKDLEPVAQTPQTEWYSVGTGILLKTAFHQNQSNGVIEYTLISASINGQPLIGIGQ